MSSAKRGRGEGGDGAAASVPDDLLRAAREAFANAYAPYSRFQVGAALRDTSGAIRVGANVENSSLGMTRCAEQSAVQAMATAGLRTFDEIVVYTESSPPASPCGACRQVLFEFSPNAAVYLVNGAGEVIVTRVADLLPLGFRLSEARDESTREDEEEA
ncbi:MAG: cytidine deaminase [Trueperaceae bacterium]